MQQTLIVPYRRRIVPLWCLAVLLLVSACTPQSPQNTASVSIDSHLPVVQHQSQQTNLLTNGTFENGNLDGWTIGDTTSASNADAHSGTWSARIAYAGAVGAGIETDVATKIGETYKLTGWVKIISETGSDWGGFRLEATSWDWKSLGTSGPLLASARGNAWFKIALAFTAISDQTRIQIGYFGGPGRSQVVNVDDLALFVKGPNLPPNVAINLTPSATDHLPLTQQYSITGDDPDGAIVRVVWDFGDGTRALTPSGSRRVAQPGSYTATVRVADDEGAVVVKTIGWTVGGGDIPSLTINTPAENNQVVHSATLALSGSASGSATSVRVSSDRDFAGAASETTAWTAQVPLQPGWNRLLIQADDASGQIGTAERLVRYVPDPPLRVSGLAESAPSIERWASLEITFALEHSAATNPQFPFDPAPPPGLEWIDGTSVDALFTPDNWQTVFRRPAFLDQHYDRALKSDQEWLYPNGAPVWTVRFAPPTIGTWKYRIEATEARGTARSEERSFTVTAAGSLGNHGPVQIAPHDSRYFEYADGTPFLGGGHGISFSPDRFSYDASASSTQSAKATRTSFAPGSAGIFGGRPGSRGIR